MLPGERDSVWVRSGRRAAATGVLWQWCSEVHCHVLGPASVLRSVLCNRLQGREVQSRGSTETSAVSNPLSCNDGGGSSSSSSSSSSSTNNIDNNNIITIIMMSQEIMVSYKSTCRIFCKVGHITCT